MLRQLLQEREELVKKVRSLTETLEVSMKFGEVTVWPAASLV